MIICAAIKVKDTVICGYRHADCYETLHKLNPQLSREAISTPDAVVEGFLASHNDFLDRFDAYTEAIRCGQLSFIVLENKREHNENMLFSEDLY